MAGHGGKINILQFLELSSRYPVADVRSPGEFNYGHIPGAVNIPLFDDRERAIVGTIYKNEGRIKAILKGVDLASAAMSARLEKGLEVAADGKLLVHCWRGGMRSEAMAFLFSMGDIHTEVLEGGYKAYRNYILEELAGKRRYFILGGLTGSGKTELLKYLKENAGQQAVDLEGLACHKGSAFGSIGQPPQPTSEHFANLLHKELSANDGAQIIWLEDESKNIGTVFMPDGFFKNMREAPVVAIIMDVKTRMPRLLREYSRHSKEELVRSVMKISKRLGGDKTRESIESIESGDFTKAIEITLGYYDKTYLYGLKQRPADNIIYVETGTDDVAVNAGKVLEAAEKFISRNRPI
jgi:tRNA 2-selenouridine synthase